MTATNKKRTDNRQIRPKMLSSTEHLLGPEDILEIEILPKPATSQNIFIIVFSRFSRIPFANPTQKVTARTNGRCMGDVKIRQSDLPTLILKRLSIPVRSRRRDNENLEKQIGHASTELAKTI